MNPSNFDNEDYEDYEDDNGHDYQSGFRWVLKAVEKNVILRRSTGYLTEVQSAIIDSCLARGDREKAEQLIQDWNNERDGKRPTADISKWLPGDHYYALDKKFRTLGDAESYLQSRGYRFSGKIRERFEYRESGG